MDEWSPVIIQYKKHSCHLFAFLPSFLSFLSSPRDEPYEKKPSLTIQMRRNNYLYIDLYKKKVYVMDNGRSGLNGIIQSSGLVGLFTVTKTPG